MTRSIPLFLVLAPLLAARGADAIKLRGGGVVDGAITAITARELRLRDASGQERVFPAEEVSSFTLDDPPPSLRQADLAAGARDLEGAVAGYRAALRELAEGKCRDLHRPAIELKLARAQRALGDHAGALATLKALRQGCRDCRQRVESCRESLEVARISGDRAALERVVEEVKSEPEPLPGWAELELARSRFDGGDAPAAWETLSRLATGEPRPFSAEARLWGLRALETMGRREEMEKLCREALEDRAGSPPALVQAAGRALGEMRLGAAASDPGAAREALLLLARAISAGPPTREDGLQDHARALLLAARACLLPRGEAAPTAKEELRSRAISYYREVSRTYRRSPWATEAAAGLARLEEKDAER